MHDADFKVPHRPPTVEGICASGFGPKGNIEVKTQAISVNRTGKTNKEEERMFKSTIFVGELVILLEGERKRDFPGGRA